MKKLFSSLVLISFLFYSPLLFAQSVSPWNVRVSGDYSIDDISEQINSYSPELLKCFPRSLKKAGKEIKSWEITLSYKINHSGKIDNLKLVKMSPQYINNGKCVIKKFSEFPVSLLKEGKSSEVLLILRYQNLSLSDGNYTIRTSQVKSIELKKVIPVVSLSKISTIPSRIIRMEKLIDKLEPSLIKVNNCFKASAIKQDFSINLPVSLKLEYKVQNNGTVSEWNLQSSGNKAADICLEPLQKVRYEKLPINNPVIVKMQVDLTAQE